MDTTSYSTSENPLPACVVIAARKKHTATVIISHGLGDSAKNFGYYLGGLKDHPHLGHVKFILPSAPMISVTANRGRVMPSWFDCYSFDLLNRKEDEVGLFRSVGWIKQLIKNEETQHNIPSNRVVIGGFSQGGSISVLTGITIDKPLAGMFALSASVPLRLKVSELSTSYSKNFPILWCHGRADQQVRYKDWKAIAEALSKQLSIPFTTSDYPQDFLSDSFNRDVGNGSTDGKGAVSSGRLHFRSYEGLSHGIESYELSEVAAWIALHIPGEA